MACTNISCQYHDGTRPNGCTLFPGSSWLNCRGAEVVRKIQTKPDAKTNKNGK